MLTYNEKMHPLARVYSRIIQRNVLYRLLPELSSTPFRYHYRLCRSAFIRTFLWVFLKKGDNAIQVGCSRALLSKGGPSLVYGASQPLVMSAIVGCQGHVWVIEPVKENVDELNSYVVRNKISNVTVIPRGIYREKGKVHFLVDRDRASENVILHVNPPQGLNEKNSRSKHSIEELEVDTLDNVIQEERIPKVKFVNITVNGTEFEAIEGMQDLMKTNVVISFPIQTQRTFNSPILRCLGDRGFKIHVENAPVSRATPQFIVVAAYKNYLRAPSKCFEVDLLSRHRIIVVKKEPVRTLCNKVGVS